MAYFILDNYVLAKYLQNTFSPYLNITLVFIGNLNKFSIFNSYL